MAERIRLTPAELLIDEGNPRLPTPNAGQREALRALAQSDERKFVRLAEDIVSEGSLDPSNLMIVTPLNAERKKYVVLEGNRRIGTIRAMENPELLAGAIGEKAMASLRKASTNYLSAPVEEVECVLVKDRQEADHWIQLRHTGENEGRGVVGWGSQETTRFRMRTEAAPLPIELQALDFLEAQGRISPIDRASISVTNLERLLDTPEVRAKLGIDFREGKLLLLGLDKDVASALMHVVDDLRAGLKVGAIYDKAKRVAYANKLPPSVVVTPKGAPRTAAASTAAPKSGAKSQAPKKRPKVRDYLIPRDCTLHGTSGRLLAIETELRKLTISNYPNAVSVLLRVFIELSVDTYVETWKLKGIKESDSLSKKLQAVADDLVAKQKLTKQQAKAVRRASSADSLLAPSVDLMHSYVHNQYVYPTPGDLRGSWDTLQPFVVACWAP